MAAAAVRAASGSGARGRDPRHLARAVGLAPARLGCRRRRGRDVRPGRQTCSLQPSARDERLRLARRPARRAGCPLGCRLVPGDRALRVQPRSQRLHRRGRAFGVLSALSPWDQGGLRARRAAGDRWGVALAARARARALRHPPSHDARSAPVDRHPRAGRLSAAGAGRRRPAEAARRRAWRCW